MEDIENPEVAKQIVLCNTKFAFNLYKELTKDSGEDGNFVVSPFAISVALAAALLGAREETATQIRQAMKLDLFDLDDEALRQGFGELVDLIINHSDAKLTLLNGIFAQEGFPYEEEYEAAAGSLHAELRSLNFAHAHQASMAEINQWVEEATAQQVTSLMSSLDSETLMAMVNVAVYKGQWPTKFERSRREFHSGDGLATKTAFIGSTGEYGWAEVPDLQAEVVELPYAGDELSLFLLLPNEVDGLSRVEEQLTGDSVDDVLSAMQDELVTVLLPKFKIEFGLNLEESLQHLNITDIFKLGVSDLSGVDGTEALYVKKFTHRTLLEIAEDGAEVAPPVAKGGEDARRFTADRPFMYFLLDNRTETILMMGRYTSPPSRARATNQGSMTNRMRSLYKRMTSTKDRSGSTSAASAEPPKSSGASGSSKARAPAPPAPAATGASYSADTNQVHLAENPPAERKKKKTSKGIFCCLRGGAGDIDFDTL